MNATATAGAFTDWIRPWYPAGAVGHALADCPTLLRVEPEPRAGAGWLNPHRGQVCDTCLKRAGYPLWDAECHTCESSLAEEKSEDDDRTWTTKQDAIAWKRDHRCEPAVSLIDPLPAAPAHYLTQPALFPAAEAAA